MDERTVNYGFGVPVHEAGSDALGPKKEAFGRSGLKMPARFCMIYKKGDTRGGGAGAV